MGIVTMSDIAARAGTTVGVVSVTLNGAKSKTLRVSDATRERVLRAAEELGYRRDRRASALATGRNETIGLMLPHVDSFAAPDPFYSLVTAGVAAAAARRGYNLMLYTAVAEEESERAAQTIDRRVDGVILVIPPNGTPLYEECRRQGVAVVALTESPGRAALTVNSDDYEGARLAMDHLLRLGHRRIAHLHGNLDILSSLPRVQAYRDALQAAGVEFDPELLADGGFSRSVARDSMRRLLDARRPTAVFAANDLSAHGVLDALAERGLRTPEDVSVVGYDDTWYASVTDPPLTSVRTDVDGTGRRAADLLIDALEGKVEEAHPVLPVSLTVRRSTGPILLKEENS